MKNATRGNPTLPLIIARIRAILRRREKERGGPEQLVAGWISLDLDRHQVTVDGHMVDLTNKEFSILELMMREPGRVFARRELVGEFGEKIRRSKIRR